MFRFLQWIQRPKFDAAKDTGADFEKIHEEQMHNYCEATDRNETLWSAPLNL